MRSAVTIRFGIAGATGVPTAVGVGAGTPTAAAAAVATAIRAAKAALGLGAAGMTGDAMGIGGCRSGAGGLPGIAMFGEVPHQTRLLYAYSIVRGCEKQQAER